MLVLKRKQFELNYSGFSSAEAECVDQVSENTGVSFIFYLLPKDFTCIFFVFFTVGEL